MLEKAIEKIKEEMSKNNNPYVQVVGKFLIQYIEKNPEAAEKILNEKKTIVKSLDEMKKAAEKKKVGNCAVLTDQEGFEEVLKYFEIDGEYKPEPFKFKENVTKTQPIENKKNDTKKVNFDVKLDDLL